MCRRERTGVPEIRKQHCRLAGHSIHTVAAVISSHTRPKTTQSCHPAVGGPGVLLSGGAGGVSWPRPTPSAPGPAGPPDLLALCPCFLPQLFSLAHVSSDCNLERLFPFNGDSDHAGPSSGLRRVWKLGCGHPGGGGIVLSTTSI